MFDDPAGRNQPFYPPLLSHLLYIKLRANFYLIDFKEKQKVVIFLTTLILLS